jgi:hypothetical protein
MRRFVPALLLATFVATALPRSAGATPLFLLDTDEATYTLLHRVNPETGELTTIGELPPDDVIVSLAAANDNLLYAVAYGGALVRITVSPFGYTRVGDVGPNHIVGLAYGNRALYAVDEGTNALLRINPNTGNTTVIGTIRLANEPLEARGGDIVEAANGTWYLWTNWSQALYTLNVSTAVATPVPDQQQQEQWQAWYSGLAFDYATGKLYGSSVLEDLLVATDTSSGAPLGGVPLCLDCPDLHDLAFGDMASPRCSDGDNDGFFAERGCGLLRDCDDTNASVNPLAREKCNGRDDDCDGVVDDGASRSCNNDGDKCTVGETCQAGACRGGTPRNCGAIRLLSGATCRQSDGACCGKLFGGLLPNLTICLP